jgi:hypothetical protein
MEDRFLSGVTALVVASMACNLGVMGLGAARWHSHNYINTGYPHRLIDPVDGHAGGCGFTDDSIG